MGQGRRAPAPLQGFLQEVGAPCAWGSAGPCCLFSTCLSAGEVGVAVLAAEGWGVMSDVKGHDSSVSSCPCFRGELL